MSREEAGRPRPAATQTGVDLLRRLAPGTQLAGRYRIEEPLGVGGMGVVYRARDEELGVHVAVKVLRPDLGADPQWVERFRRELVLAREVTHRNVVRSHDIAESGGLRFLTMRYVAGRSLREVLEKEGPLPLPRALAIVRQIADALASAHDAGVVHRDLKPGNILLEADDTAYVTDFGVARFLEHGGLTQAGAVVGTPDYLSPEQIGGDAVDGRADLYALGIVFYEMLTGALPFKGDTQTELLAQRLTGSVRDVAAAGIRVPAYVERVIRRCLERSPARRYQTGRELLADLDRPGRVFPRRALGTGVAAVLGLLAVGAGWGMLRHRSLPLSTPGHVPAAAAREARASVAVLPLADDTADPALSWTGTGLAEMLAASLAESADLRVLDPLRVFRTLRDLKLAADRLDEDQLRRLADLLEVDHLVAGSVRRAGPALRVDLRLCSVDPAGTLSTRVLSSETAETGGLFRLAGSLGEQARAALGSARPRGSDAAPPGTSSLEAARAWREGRERLLVGDYVGAAPAFERAVAADADFAAALEQLSETYQNLGYDEKALAAAERAARAAKPAEVRLGYRIRARLALLRGAPAEAEGIYGELASRYPNDVETLLSLASAQASRGDLGAAVATLKTATAKDPGDPRAWFLLGKNTILIGDAPKALADHLVRALALMTQLKNEQGQADVLNAMGVAHHELGDYPHALENYSKAAAIRERVGDRRGVAMSLRNRARTYVAQGRIAEAEPDLENARRLYGAIGDQGGLADVWNESGGLEEGRAEYGRARAAYQEALKIRRQLGDLGQLAQSYDNLGYIFFLEGEYDSALVYWQQALDLRRKVGDKAGAVQSVQNLGFLQIAQGRFAEATKSFLQALDEARPLDFKNALAVSHGNLGLLHQYAGRYSSALTSYAEALRLLKELDDKRGLAEFALKEAGALLELGRLDAAKLRLDAAAALIEATGNREQAADRLALVGEWHLARGENDAGLAALAKAVAEAEASRSRVASLRARVARGAGRVATGDAAAAAELAAAVRDADTIGDALLRIRASAALARAELARGRAPAAEQAARRALKTAERCGWEAGLPGLHALLARILERNKDASGAAEHYRESARLDARIASGLDADLRRDFEARAASREVAAWLAAHPAPPASGGGG